MKSQAIISVMYAKSNKTDTCIYDTIVIINFAFVACWNMDASQIITCRRIVSNKTIFLTNYKNLNISAIIAETFQYYTCVLFLRPILYIYR